MKAWDPVLGATVEQRYFTPEDEKQAVLMEMYTEHRLTLYVAALEEVANNDSWQPSKEPPVSLATHVRKPMLACALSPRSHADK